ncbi:immunity 63 family protein [Mycolicibacterium goodii]|uniref:Imm63 family immunity protein n=1 Tax=Mycolicibacterium goodii TaxID=134601 RepID=UPI001BDD9573|nr:Imm63 family immunity protein [Mycolicibacterium goodii]MBU8820313.1 immunity 63 family protein [Mycolicibacterium goodii]
MPDANNTQSEPMNTTPVNDDVSAFSIRELRAGPVELRRVLPATARVLRKLTGPRGRGELFCARLEQPVKYLLPADFDTRRCQREFLGYEESSPFLWVHIIVVAAHNPGERLHGGMTRFPVDIAYVVDLTLGQDTTLDPAKVDYVAIAEVDDSSENVRKSDIAESINAIASSLSSLSGLDPGSNAPRPLGAGALSDGQRLYELGAVFRYYSDDGTGWSWRLTGDLDEFLYWIADDIARELAWQWAQRAPSFAELDDVQRRALLWVPQWCALMTALNPRWGQRRNRALQQGPTEMRG